MSASSTSDTPGEIQTEGLRKFLWQAGGHEISFQTSTDEYIFFKLITPL